MGGGEQKVPIDVLSCSKQISNLSFCLEFCPKHQNIIFKSKIRKVRAGTYADLSILLSNVRELWQICGLIQPARRACALRALGLLMADGGRLFDRSVGFFYGNSCNSGTKSRKIVSKVGN